MRSKGKVKLAKKMVKMMMKMPEFISIPKKYFASLNFVFQAKIILTFSFQGNIVNLKAPTF